MKTFAILFYAFVGWALCAAVLGIGIIHTSLKTALIIHAVAAPIIFVFVSRTFYRNFQFAYPILIAIIFASFVMVVDFGIVALFYAKKLAAFASAASLWIAFALIFLCTYIIGSLNTDWE